VQLRQARTEAEKLLQQAHAEARQALSEAAQKRAELQNAEMELRRRELTVDRATTTAASTTEEARAESRRLQEAKAVLAERESLAATREEIISARESEVQRRHVELEAAELRVAHWMRRKHAARHVGAAAADPGEPVLAPSSLRFEMGGVRGQEQMNKADPDPFNGKENVISSSHKAPLLSALAKGAARLERLQGIVRSIAEAGTSQPEAVTAAQLQVKQLSVQLEEVKQSLSLLHSNGGDEEDDGKHGVGLRAEVVRWETSLAALLEEVVAMQRAALAARSSPAAGGLV